MTEDKVITRWDDRKVCEERPYDQCPHCDEYKYRKRIYKVWQSSASLLEQIFGDSSGEWAVTHVEKECLNCRYSESEDLSS